MDEMEPEIFSEYTDTKANLNYEGLLARAVDRCLHNRVGFAKTDFIFSVHALDLALVDMPNKPLRSEFDQWVNNPANALYSSSQFQGHTEAVVFVHDAAFKEITRILSKHHMLFKSTMIEVNR